MTSPPPTSATPTSPRRPVLYAALALIAVALVAYGPTISSDFVRLDDPQYVMENPLVRNPSLTSAVRFFTEVRKPSTVAGYYQPLTMLSFMLDAMLSGGGEVNSGICHLHNILLHAATCVLLMLLLRIAVGGLTVPFILALLFAVHPVNVESVAWISQRKTVLATPLALGCLLCYLHYVRARDRRLLFASIGLYLLANLAKPTIVLLPLVLPLLDVWPLRRRAIASLPEKWPFAIIMVVMAYVAAVSQASSIATLGVPNLGSIDVLMRWAALLAYNIALYFGNVFWPLHLSPFRPVPESLAFSSGPILLSTLLVLIVIIAWVIAWRAYKPLFVGLTAFAVTLALALGPVRFFDSCVADRFLYFPFVFLLIAASAAVIDIEALSRQKTRLLRYAVCLLVVPLLILMRAQQRIWQNGVTFWTHVADAVPDYGIAHILLGMAYLEEKKLDDALQHAQRGYELRPDDDDAVGLLGRVKTQRGQAAESAVFLRDALTKPLLPNAAGAQLSLAEALIVTGDMEGARAAVAQALKLKCPAGAAYERLGDAALQKIRRFDFAAWAYREAVKADPENLTARWNLGTALEALGDPAEALREYEAVLIRYARIGRPSEQLQAAAQRLRIQLQDTTPTPPATQRSTFDSTRG